MSIQLQGERGSFEVETPLGETDPCELFRNGAPYGDEVVANGDRISLVCWRRALYVGLFEFTVQDEAPAEIRDLFIQGASFIDDRVGSGAFDWSPERLLRQLQRIPDQASTT